MENSLSEKQSKRIRRFAAKGLFEPLERTATVKWAESNQEFLFSFNLLYKRYRELNYIEESTCFPFHCTAYSGLPETKKAILIKNQAIISTVDIVLDNKCAGLPMDQIYGRELDNLRHQGRKICEVGSLACTHDANWQNTFMPLFRVVFWHALNTGMNDICIMVNPKHEAFYRSIMVMDKLGEEKFYPCVNAPAVSLRMNLDTYKSTLKKAYHGFSSEDSLYSYFYHWESTASRHESRMIRSNPISHMDARFLNSLILKDSGLIQTLSLKSKNLTVEPSYLSKSQPVMET